MIKKRQNQPEPATRLRRSLFVAVTASLCAAGTPLWLAGAALAGVTVPVADPDPIHWTLYSSDPAACNAPPPASRSLSCGDYGTFYFGPNLPQLDCTTVAGGTETEPGGYKLTGFQVSAVEYYTQSSQIFPLIGTKAHQGDNSGLGDPGEAPTEPPQPCADGSCSNPPGGHNGQQLWLMVLDWANGPQAEHGQMMTALGKQIWQRAVHLAGVDESELVDLLGPDTTDAHLIGKLCQIVDPIHEGTLRPPTGLSMSLGRHQANNGSTTACTRDSNKLTCQLEQVIQQLVDEGTLVFAAAGNYQEIELPASLPNVTDVGNLDLAAFQQRSVIQPAWETPTASSLLFPGYGVCVEYLHAGERLLYPAPGGASYSNIIAASMISRAALAYHLSEPLAHSWKPSWQGPTHELGEGFADGCFVFGDFQTPYCNQAVDRIMKRMLGFPINKCWSSEISSEVLEITMPAGAPATGVTTHQPGLSECLADHQPAPTSDLCIPCGMEQSKAKADQLWQSEVTSRPIDTRRDVVLDISATTPLNEPGSSVSLEITELYLRIEDDFYRLLSSSEPIAKPQLKGLAQAQYKTLVIFGAIPFVPAGSQPSLVAFFRQTNSAGVPAPSCWHSSPLTLMGGQGSDSFFP